MKNQRIIACTCLLAGVGLAATAVGTRRAAEEVATAQALPIPWQDAPTAQIGERAASTAWIEPNRGQFAPEVSYACRTAGLTTFLHAGAATFVLPGADRSAAHAIRMRFEGGDPGARAKGGRRLAGVGHTLLGSDPDAWVTGVPHFERVRIAEVYPGIDVVFHTGSGLLEYDFVVRPGADVRQIRLGFDGTDGLRLDREGALVLAAGETELVHRAPVSYQDADGRRRDVQGRFVIDGPSTVRFAIDDFDPSLPLVIDPQVAHSTYFGGATFDQIYGVTTDPGGNVIVTGETASPDFPTTRGAFDRQAGGTDAFVAKFDGVTGELIYSTRLGGGAQDFGRVVVADAEGNAFTAGWTKSDDFPTVGPVQGARGGEADAFVAKLSPDGSALVYSTYFGGTDDDSAYGIDLDTAGSAYVLGRTESTDLATSAAAVQPANAGERDAFVVKINPSGAAVVYATYLGSPGRELTAGGDVRVTAAGEAVIVGDTNSPATFPATVRTFEGSGEDAFVAKLNPTGSALVFATLLGGTGRDSAIGVAFGSAGSIWVAGDTLSLTFPTVNPVQEQSGGNIDFHISRLTADGSTLLSATYFGGAGSETVTGVAEAPDGGVYVLGTVPGAFPVTDPVGNPPAGDRDFGLVRLSADGSAVVFALTVGGADAEVGSQTSHGLATDGRDNVFLAGSTASTDYPRIGAQAPATDEGNDGVLTKICDLDAADCPDTLTVVVDKGSVKDSAKPRKDKLTAQGTFLFLEGSPDSAFDPATDDTELRFGNAGCPLVVTIPAGDPGWKTNRAGTKITWKSARKTTPKVKFSLDTKKGRFKLKASKAHVPAPPVSPITVLLCIGDDGGSDTADWPQKKPGLLKYKRPKE